jgi:pimeloyl-ACP methyl ester carboxylesterase
MDKAFMDAFQKSTLVKPIDPVYYDTIVAEGMKIPTHVFKAALTGIMNVDFTTQLKQVQKPVLIVWGSKDEICPRTDQDEMVKQFPKAKLLVYQNTGHALHWEEPRRFATDLLRFIQTEDPKL